MKPAARFESLPPYTPIEPFEVLSERIGLPIDQIVKMDANENPYGPSPRARQALADLAFTHIYPDPESRQLRAALAKFTSVPVEFILAGAGADELIDLLVRVMLEPGDCVMVCPPTFSMYSFDTVLNAGQVINVPRRADFSLDVQAILDAVKVHKPKILFLTNPNNPDGRLMSESDIDTLINLPLLVVIDEAYIEFCDNGGKLGENLSQIQEVSRRENLVVLRTFSKWAGLAGLRVGYGAFPGWLMSYLWKAKQPYNVSVAASHAAIASLLDVDLLAVNVARLRAERERLFSRLAALPFLRPVPSQTNFILCPVIGLPAVELKNELVKKGIIVRYYDTPLLKDCIRVTVGRPGDTDQLTAALVGNIADPVIRQQISKLWSFAIPDDINLSLENEYRAAAIQRQTGETQVSVRLSLDGSGKHDIQTGIGFFDHMLTQIAAHGLFDLEIHAQGDLHIDHHHTIEDVALTLGSAFAKALGDRKGIQRAGWALFPLDDALASAAVDFSGRPFTSFQVIWNGPQTGSIPNSLWQHFFESFANRAGCNLHLEIRYGRDDHHQVEALFKAFARAMDTAVRLDPRREGKVPSSKGTVTV